MGFRICGSPIIILCHNWKTQTQGEGTTRRSPDVSMMYWTEAVLKAACWSVGVTTTTQQEQLSTCGLLVWTEPAPSETCLTNIAQQVALPFFKEVVAYFNLNLL